MPAIFKLLAFLHIRFFLKKTHVITINNKTSMISELNQDASL